MNLRCNSPAGKRLVTAAPLMVLFLLLASSVAIEAAPRDQRALVISQNDGPQGPPPFAPGNDEGIPDPSFNSGGGPGGPGGPGFGGPGGPRFGGPGGPRFGGPGMEGQGDPNQQFRRAKRWRQQNGGPGGFGGRGGRPGMPGMGGKFNAGGRRLDLTPLGLSEQQKTKIQSLREQTRQQAKEIRKNLFLKQMKLRDLLFSPDASDAQIMSARRDMRDLQDKMDEINIKDMLAIRGVLTAEQKAKLPQVMPGRRDTASGATLRTRAKVAGQTTVQD